jgi:hypothetical protein
MGMEGLELLSSESSFERERGCSLGPRMDFVPERVRELAAGNLPLPEVISRVIAFCTFSPYIQKYLTVLCGLLMTIILKCGSP